MGVRSKKKDIPCCPERNTKYILVLLITRHALYQYSPWIYTNVIKLKELYSKKAMKWHTILAMGEAHYIELHDKQKASKAVIN